MCIKKCYIEYRYFSTERVIAYSPSGGAYGIIIGDNTLVTKERKSYRLFVDWLVEEAYHLRMNRSPVITTYTTFHYSSEIHGKNHRYRSEKDNCIIRNSYKNRTIIIHWDRFIWVQSNPCFTILYGKSKTYEKKKIRHQTITNSS